MKFILYNIGKTDTKYISEGISEYTKRLKHFIDFSIIDLPELKDTRNLSPQIFKQKEGDILNKALKEADLIVLLDENGTEYDSECFAKWLNKLMNMGGRQIAFVTGGAYGFSEDIYSRAQHKICLSRMTFTHQLARLIFVEQLYRAFTILKGLPYHNY